jgi:hypothetical protein
MQTVTQAHVSLSLLLQFNSLHIDEIPVARILSPLPDVVPNSISDEPSITPEESESQASCRPTRLVRRVARSVSREPSQPPTVEPEKVDEPAPSRPRRVRACVTAHERYSLFMFIQLIRRVITGPPIITGLDDPSSVIDAVPDLPPRNATPPREGYNSTVRDDVSLLPILYLPVDQGTDTCTFYETEKESGSCGSGGSSELYVIWNRGNDGRRTASQEVQSPF